MRVWLNRGRGTTLRRHRLAFERLERRDLLTVMRIVNWNTLNGPNDASGDANFQTVLQAIGDETVQGNTQRIDILALQETDPNGLGSNSIERVQSVFNGLYPSGNYEYAVTTEDGGGDSTGFVFDTTSVSLLESTLVAPESLIHNVMRGKFRPSDTFGESDFYVYSIHLKSGATGADATIRGSEAIVLRADADSLGEGANVLMVGDFNMKTSSETAWANLTSAGSGQVQDVANTPGSWFGNPAFKIVHSQDPRTNMDDRFDIQFGSGEVFDGIGFEYVVGSYHVFGNNGTHTLGGSITAGMGATPTVLSALVAASDHLPVVADYEVVVSTPNVRITQTSGETKVIEGGLYDTYQIVLDTVPAADVSVIVTPNAQLDIGNGTGVAKVFTFTPANALTPQTVVVNAVNDLLGEGTQTATITHSSASADATYNGLPISNVAVTVLDNDAPTIVINELDSDQAGTDTGEFVELYDGGIGNVSLTGKTLVFFNGNGSTAYRTIDLTGYSTNASGFFVVGNLGVPGVSLGVATIPSSSLQNGEDAVALYAGSFSNGSPVTTSNLLDAIVYSNGQTDGSGLYSLVIASPFSVDESQNSSGLTEALARVSDGGIPRNLSTYRAQMPTPGTFNQAYPGGVQFIQSGSRVDVQEGGATDSYQIALQTIPTSNVTITVDPDSQTNLGSGAGVPIMLMFTPADALIPQIVTVMAVDDAAIEGAHSSIIAHTAASADSRYNGLAISNVVANIVDNDAAAPVSIVISEVMYNPATSEGGAALPEWIEVVNTGGSAVDLGSWLFDDEDGSNWGAIPAGTILNPNQIAVFFDSSFTTVPAFRSDWAVPAGAVVVGVSWGSLANNPSPANEILQLFNNIGVEVDVVNFDDASPWPATADGPSIYLKDLSADNNNGANWARSSTAAKAVSPTGGVFSASDVGAPGRVFLAGDYNLNGAVDASDYVLWRETLGSSTDLRADGSGPSVGVPNGVVDQADYTFWRSSFGAVGVPNGGLGSGAGVGTGGSSAVLSPASVDFGIADFGNGLSKLTSASRGGTSLPNTFQPASTTDDLLLAISSAHRADSVQRDDPLANMDSRDDYATDEIFAEFSGGVAIEI